MYNSYFKLYHQCKEIKFWGLIHLTPCHTSPIENSTHHAIWLLHVTMQIRWGIRQKIISWMWENRILWLVHLTPYITSTVENSTTFLINANTIGYRRKILSAFGCGLFQLLFSLPYEKEIKYRNLTRIFSHNPLWDDYGRAGRSLKKS